MAMASSFSPLSSSSRGTVCSLCHDSFFNLHRRNVPLLLVPCGHTFCAPCLSQQLGGQRGSLDSGALGAAPAGGDFAHRGDLDGGAGDFAHTSSAPAPSPSVRARAYNCALCGSFIPPDAILPPNAALGALLDEHARTLPHIPGKNKHNNVDTPEASYANLKQIIDDAARGHIKPKMNAAQCRSLARSLAKTADDLARKERAGGAQVLLTILNNGHAAHERAMERATKQLAILDADIVNVEKEWKEKGGNDDDNDDDDENNMNEDEEEEEEAAAAQRALDHVDELAIAYLGVAVPDVGADGDRPEGGLKTTTPPAADVDANVPAPGEALGVVRRAVEALSSRGQLRFIADVPSVDSVTTSLATNSRDSSNARIVASLEFDAAGDHVAAAGVARCIRIYRFHDSAKAAKLASIRDADKEREPKRLRRSNAEASDSAAAASAGAAEYSAQPKLCIDVKNKLSCLSWCRMASQSAPLASADYEGVVSLYDPSTGVLLRDTCEHVRRLWSVAFAGEGRLESFATGGDDGRVKLWSVRKPCSTMTLELRANVCAVEFQPNDPNVLAVGSADHRVRLFDLRAAHANRPLVELWGHTRAVSYVRWLTGEDTPRGGALVSASIDGALKLWEGLDGAAGRCVRSFAGHVNERNFVGLAAGAGDASSFLACGSETNAVFTYHRSLSKPVATHSFSGSSDTSHSGYRFVSAVAWRPKTTTLLAANSRGRIRILELGE